MSLKLPLLWPMKERKWGQGGRHEKNEEMKEREENKLIIFRQWLFFLDIATSAPLEGLLVGRVGECCGLLSLLIPQISSVPSPAPPHHMCINKTESLWGSSLAVQWLRLCVSTMRDVGSIFGWETKVLHAGGPKEKQSHFKYSLGTFSSSIT